MIDKEIAEMLESEARRMNSEGFINDDPVRFPRQFNDLRDIEITAILVSAIAWGNRTMILRNADRMLSLADRQPYRYVMEKGYEELPDGQNIHRTFFTQNFKHFLRGLHEVYSRYESIEQMVSKLCIDKSAFPAWELADALNHSFCRANDGRTDSRCLPLNTSNTALKRLNMALRWLVRNDGIVDLGVWKSLTPAQLYIPLDVHVADVSRGLGLLERRSNDRRAVIELTETLRRLRPDDPTFYDFALFGIGVTGRKGNLNPNGFIDLGN